MDHAALMDTWYMKWTREQEARGRPSPSLLALHNPAIEARAESFAQKQHTTVTASNTLPTYAMEDGDYEKAHIGTHTHNSYSEKERKDILEADLTYSDAKLDEMGAEKLATEMKRETEEKRAAFKRRAEKMIKRADALAKMTPEEATAAEKIAKALSPRKRARSAPASAAKPTGPTRSAGRSATPELRDRGGDVSSGDEAEETGPSSAGAKKPYKAWKEDENKFVIEARNEKPPMSYEEIAKELGRKAGAVRKHHSDLMKKA